MVHNYHYDDRRVSLHVQTKFEIYSLLTDYHTFHLMNDGDSSSKFLHVDDLLFLTTWCNFVRWWW